MKERILAQLDGNCPWGEHLHWFDTIDSTSTRAKAMAVEGAPHGSILIAGQQTGGRGRLGRSFSSPDRMGVYLSVILRPQCPAGQLMHLTCAVGVAMCKAIGQVCDLDVGIKWVNDLVWSKRKLGGILTELSVNSKTGLVEYAVVGIGINCLQKQSDFPAELQDMAISLEMAAQRAVDPAAVAAAMIRQLFQMDQQLFQSKACLMAEYRRLCVTLGQMVRIVGDDTQGLATDILEDGTLVIRMADGSEKNIRSGEVSVRGMYGYI